MDYFLDKLKAYDNLIDEREKKLEELNELINNKENELNKKEENKDTSNSPIFLYDMKNISYKDNDIFKKMKEVDQKFNFDNRKIIDEFLNNKFDISLIEDYNKYSMVKERFHQDVVFDILTKKESRQIEEVKELLGDYAFMLDDFMKGNKEFHLKKFISYLNQMIEDLDPYIYISVGDKSENYNDMNKYIRTEFDDSIFKGIRIVYRGKLYDYSI